MTPGESRRFATSPAPGIAERGPGRARGAATWRRSARWRSSGARGRSAGGTRDRPSRGSTGACWGSQIGPWTVQCLGLRGRGDPDSLPAGDLGFVKLVGRLGGDGRRATVEEVEEFFAPYAPFRGLAGASRSNATTACEEAPQVKLAA